MPLLRSYLNQEKKKESLLNVLDVQQNYIHAYQSNTKILFLEPRKENTFYMTLKPDVIESDAHLNLILTLTHILYLT